MWHTITNLSALRRRLLERAVEDGACHRKKEEGKDDGARQWKKRGQRRGARQRKKRGRRRGPCQRKKRGRRRGPCQRKKRGRRRSARQRKKRGRGQGLDGSRAAAARLGARQRDETSRRSSAADALGIPFHYMTSHCYTISSCTSAAERRGYRRARSSAARGGLGPRARRTPTHPHTHAAVTRGACLQGRHTRCVV